MDRLIGSRGKGRKPQMFITVEEHEALLRQAEDEAFRRGSDRCEVITEHVPDWRTEEARRALSAVNRLKLGGEAMLDCRPGETVFARVLDYFEEAARP